MGLTLQAMIHMSYFLNFVELLLGTHVRVDLD